MALGDPYSDGEIYMVIVCFHFLLMRPNVAVPWRIGISQNTRVAKIIMITSATHSACIYREGCVPRPSSRSVILDVASMMVLSFRA